MFAFVLSPVGPAASTALSHSALAPRRAPLHAGASRFLAHTPLTLLPSAVMEKTARDAALAQTRTSPSMNIFERLWRVVRGTANSAVSAMEDPEKIIEQTVADMNNDLVKVRQAYAEVAATTKRLERQRENAAELVAQWRSRAELALTSGEEGLAREALVKKKQQEEIVAGFDKQLGPMKSNVEQLYNGMMKLENSIGEARSKKEELIARARTAKTSQKVAEMVAGVGESNSVAAFEKMAEKVEAMEVKAQITGELAGTADTGLDAKFKALERGDVDDELEQMRKRISAKDDPTPMRLPSGKDAAVNDELEKMKREMGK
eukprot:CAMPEP_0184709744 /NCGR_PEP_ID=MMETSP0314-20130426/803_1 /TAXON_ID=38298 /ORGANISM="Rhodella maculata, Strain CCMP 736" /LENGTH=318 /DNA_ID=CAMNT_0027171497 /DNA_START=22 /DNA_END=978 /DNA_ORIENTATION=+